MKRKWKADEMEMSINFKAMRLAWVFNIAALSTWCIVGLALNGKEPPVSSIILSIQLIIFFTTKVIMTNKMTDKE